MKILLTCLATALLSSSLFAEEACCTAPAATTDAPAAAPAAPVGHPLKGVIVGILPEKSALLVAHEEIPGVMRAMTMLLKVNPTDLAAAQKDAAITATLVKKSDGWWLENLSPVAPAAKAKID